MFISLLLQNPLIFVLVAAALIVSITFHEFAHAFSADKLGDPTARYLGRVSLNPVKHLDPIGTMLLLFVGFGWGRPVPFNPINLQNPKRDSAIISFAGPLSNFVLAFVFALLFRFVGGVGLIGDFLYLSTFYNLLLGFFNLFPFHPLDGFKVVYGLLPMNLAYQWLQMQSYGMYILLFMIITGTTGSIMGPLVSFSLRLLGF
ncbi:site-2 protease family protein [candidate division WWE3 bacterium]|jgi:Zn-dependent protease|uniref:Site-2 protease family protein n=1 Tax=candidate division WWE3 bacterium TaxID=2053526 RepID=A0A3A4ZG76_UNCKA|nr:MAG: site-2 protease family protein [candidate division WWE3 bacterium]